MIIWHSYHFKSSIHINRRFSEISLLWRPAYAPSWRSNQLATTALYSSTLVHSVQSLYISCYVFSNKLVLSHLLLRLLPHYHHIWQNCNDIYMHRLIVFLLNLSIKIVLNTCAPSMHMVWDPVKETKKG